MKVSIDTNQVGLPSLLHQAEGDDFPEPHMDTQAGQWLSEDVRNAFESWWSSTNNQNWFRSKPITLGDLKETAFFAWRAATISMMDAADI
jgi:hypothetical protein